MVYILFFLHLPCHFFEQVVSLSLSLIWFDLEEKPFMEFVGSFERIPAGWP